LRKSWCVPGMFRIGNYSNRVETIKEQPGEKGYAIGFQGAIRYINDLLPQYEHAGKAVRTELRM